MYSACLTLTFHTPIHDYWSKSVSENTIKCAVSQAQAG